MALPAGITTCTLTGGSVLDMFGNDQDATLTVTPVFGGSTVAIVWSATGADLTNDPASAAAPAGSQAAIQVPHVNQSGFLDQSGAAYSMWAYTVVLKVARTTIWTKSVQPLVGQTTIDMDMVASGPVTPPVSAPFPTVLSVNGMTGAVVIAGGGGGGGAVSSVFGRTGDVTGQSTDLTDSTSTGVALFRAAGASAARTVMGLGTAATRSAGSFDQSGDAAAAVTAHVAATDPHGDRADAAAKYVPITRTVNGKALSSNITLTASDVSAAALDGSSHLTLANAPAGTMLRVNWDGSNWVYAGAAIVARPSARTDLTFLFTDPTGLAPSPSFGLFDPSAGSDLLLQTV